jgi:peptide chain release factor 1
MIEKANIDRKLARLPEIESRLSNPATAANQKLFRELVREHAALQRLSKKSERYFSLNADLAEHRDLIGKSDADPELKELAAAEIEGIEKAHAAAEKDLMFALVPPDPSDSRNAIVEIRAGTGGDEAALFAGDLFRMYSHYCELKKWKISIVDASASNVGGYKEIIFTVQGENVYGALKFESGGHRVQRIPVTEAQGRIHTSAATVAVFPEADEDDEIEIKPDELRIDVFCSSGPGGQSVNTTYSAVRITYLPTGLAVQSQDERSQHRNKDKAMSVLKSRLLDERRRVEEEKMGNTRRNLIGSGDRGARVRTYNFPQNRLTDHRINLTLYSLNRIVEGDLDEVLSALRDSDLEMRLETEFKGQTSDVRNQKSEEDEE